MTKADLEQIIQDRVTHCLLTHIPVKLAIGSPSETEPGQLLTKKEAARLMGVSTSTIDNHARAGSLTRRYIGKSVRFEREEVLSLAQTKAARIPGQPLLKRRRA